MALIDSIKDNVDEIKDNVEDNIKDAVGAIAPGANLISGILGAGEDKTDDKPIIIQDTTIKYYLPGVGGQIDVNDNSPYQSSPLLNTYSPRLFGAPPQLTHLNDMRLMSADPSSENTPGPVGDFYLTKILQNAQVANFVVGKAIFTGGMSSIANILRVASQYGYAMSKYNVYDSGGNPTGGSSTAADILREANMDTYNKALADDTGWTEMKKASDLGLTDIDGSTTVADLDSLGSAKSVINNLSNLLSGGGKLLAPMLTSLSVQQPFYTFESDWYSYINNVKMMINSAVIMLGLQKACVRIGDDFYPIGMDVNVKKDTDVWSNYRFITANKGLGAVTSIDSQVGDTSQYVSFMVEPGPSNENFNNNIGDSQIYASVINKGNSIGNEIAFITNSSANAVDDAIVNIAGKSVDVANKVLSALTGGVGRFTAAIAGSMARSFLGDHTIYPQIFQSHSSTSEMTLKVRLNASAGDPYSYLIDILVPYFFILGMALPELSKNNASAYSFPPLIQCNIPGLWGTRLGMVKSVTVVKNPSGKDLSVHGYPLSMDVSITIVDLQHTLMTSGMNKISTFLNNHTMFDYIAQCTGVDKYRVNGSIRLVTRMALAASAVNNVFHNIGDAVLNEFTSKANRITGAYRL